jgi:hypothetical protein
MPRDLSGQRPLQKPIDLRRRGFLPVPEEQAPGIVICDFVRGGRLCALPRKRITGLNIKAASAANAESKPQTNKRCDAGRTFGFVRRCKFLR